MHTEAEIRQALAHCTGTSTYFFNDISRRQKMVYTDGVKMLAELAGAYWLIDAIASHQPTCRRDPQGMLQEMQVWTLAVNDDRSALLKCERDTGDPKPIIQEIPYTDFPLDRFKIWLEPGCTSFGHGPEEVMVAMLPSEH